MPLLQIPRFRIYCTSLPFVENNEIGLALLWRDFQASIIFPFYWSGYKYLVLQVAQTLTVRCMPFWCGLVLLMVWVERCAATYEGVAMSAMRICLRVISNVQLISIIVRPKKPFTWLQEHILGIMGVQPKLVYTRRGVWCNWKRPNRARYKINVDGSTRNGYSTGGGVIRDDSVTLLRLTLRTMVLERLQVPNLWRDGTVWNFI